MSDADAETADDANGDADAESEAPAVDLGAQTPVEGAPLARVTSRLHFPLQKSEVDRREGETVVRTADGPHELASVLEAVDDTYFESSDHFRNAVRDVIGTGPIPTE